jgi:HEPN domain-containing protein
MEIDEADLELAKSFMRKAYDDLKSAEILLEKSQYSDSTFHSQQAAEKSSKALLIMNKIFVREHIISHLLFGLEVNEEIIRSVSSLEEHWIRPRYPFVGKKLVWDPTKEYTREIAEDALKKAKFVVSEIEKILKEKYGLILEEKNER